MDLDFDLDDLVQRAAALHCADDPLELVPNEKANEAAAKSKLVGKLFRPKKLGRQVVRGYMTRAWELEHSWMISEVAPNLFIFTFKRVEDRKFFLEKGPWTADGSLLVTKEWTPKTPLQEISFNIANFWIRIFGVPGVSQSVSCFAPEIQHVNPMGFKPRDPPPLSTTVTMTKNDPEITKHTYQHQSMQGDRNLRGSTSLTSTVGQGVAGTPTAHNSQLLSDPAYSETLRETETSAEHPRASDDTIDSEVTREAQVVMETKRQNNRGGNVFVYQASAQEFNEEADFMFLPCPRHIFQPTPSTMVPPLGLSGLINVGPNYKKRKALPLMIPRIEYGRWAQGLPESLEPPSQAESINLEPRLNLKENERSFSPGPSGGNSQNNRARSRSSGSARNLKRKRANIEKNIKIYGATRTAWEPLLSTNGVDEGEEDIANQAGRSSQSSPLAQ
ncbi:hypothetical protein TorRG33x02_179100 [Trema orientale]|uniref:DUF4283 domain-containing protein n=1 Tax=Trema orientale TaxID=63057 RepID=A0A2P5ELC3_TREOI|nr:hypothetical protein TorRG33x02_179100 [Trema orientale]